MPILLVRVWAEKIGIIKARNKLTSEEKNRRMKSQHTSLSKIIKTVLCFFEKLEKLALKKSNLLPFGGSVIVVARKNAVSF